jgi:hypothetical protein
MRTLHKVNKEESLRWKNEVSWGEDETPIRRGGNVDVRPFQTCPFVGCGVVRARIGTHIRVDHNIPTNSPIYRQLMARATVTSKPAEPITPAATPSWNKLNIVSQFREWLMEDDGSRKSEKDALHYARQVGIIFEAINLTNVKNLPGMRESIRINFFRKEMDSNTKGPSTIKNYLLALIKFINFGIDRKEFDNRDDAKDLQEVMKRWISGLKKPIKTAAIERKAKQSSELWSIHYCYAIIANICYESYIV